MLKRTISTSCLLLAVLVMPTSLSLSSSMAQSQNTQQSDIGHQYDALREAKLEFKDFSFPTLENKTLNLREATRGKKLTLVSYFATWCHNSLYEVDVLNELYTKYHEQGLEIIGVCVYSSPDELRNFIQQHKPPYPICREGDDKTKDRSNTTHHRYRKQMDDKRRWGTPFNVFISASDIEERGDTITKRVRLAAGELIKADVEEFIRQQLAATSDKF